MLKILNEEDILKVYRPAKDSHKGQNGRLLVIGGSDLFHASIFWAADIASRIVDLVHFSSPAIDNNNLVRKKAKEGFWNGIVVPWRRIKDYIREDDCTLIGPGMPRKEGLEKGEVTTSEIVNPLLEKYADRKWVIDGGALQEMDPSLLNGNCIITPHLGELRRLLGNAGNEFSTPDFKLLNLEKYKDYGANNLKYSNEQIAKLSEVVFEVSQKFGCTILLKGEVDIICKGRELIAVKGGNEGMTKGGTGDVLAGLVGALYCKNDALLAAKAGSLINKRAGEKLYKEVGPYFNASDLLQEVPRTMKEILGY